jgi:hypothetical protein
VPRARSLVEQHLEDNFGEVRLHLLVADIRRFALASSDRGDDTVTTPLLDFLDLALANGDAHLRNAIAVPFVEGTGWWDPVVQPFIATWPPRLPRRLSASRFLVEPASVGILTFTAPVFASRSAYGHNRRVRIVRSGAKRSAPDASAQAQGGA